ncbi:hypothetical protein LCGC14_1404810 [marine sediment metagenome]|uniref:Uncharacterized protein n=1 Tax=marine sediment metagenome TaxID=412755 RepID=A0A0F9MXJ2_9ZZZZ
MPDVSQAAGDTITGTGHDGTTTPVGTTGPSDNEPTTFAPPGTEPTEEIDDGPQEYGISFPRAMLPLGATRGTWELEALLDLDGDENEAMVRVWLMPLPTRKVD